MNDEIREWMRSGKHLPDLMRDFHDQKDLFKAIHETTDVGDNEMAAKVDWVTGHVYVVDIFLWWMAKHGYTLQRSRRKMPFNSPRNAIEGSRRRRLEAIAQIICPEQQQ